jgi:enoyl-CoA hydratase
VSELPRPGDEDEGASAVREEFLRMQTLEITQDGPVLIVSLNRPEVLNAVSDELHEELGTVWRLVRKDATVGAIVLRGNGRAFCSGGDVKSMAEESADPMDPGARAAQMLLLARTFIADMIDVEQPIVAAVRGYAFGLGASLALCSDVVIAAHDAQFADTHVKMGLVPGDGGALLWPLLLPLNTAKYYIMTGEPVSGRRAAEVGLIVRSVPAERVDDDAQALARQLAEGPALAVRFTKVVMNKIVRERLNLLGDTALLLEAATLSSAAHARATTEFVAQRAR